MNDKQRKKIVDDFFIKADSKNLLIYNKFSAFPKHLQKSMKNRVEENKTFKHVVGFYKDTQKLKQLITFNQKTFGISDVDTRRILSHYIIFHGFNIIETHKGFLTQLINPKMPIGKRKIKVDENTTLNQIVFGLSQELKFPSLEKLFPSKLRNVLGHSGWYFQDSKFCYMDQKNQVCFTVDEFTKAFKELDKNMLEIVAQWEKRT